MSNITESPSVIATVELFYDGHNIGNHYFVLYSAISLTQGLPVYLRQAYIVCIIALLSTTCHGCVLRAFLC